MKKYLYLILVLVVFYSCSSENDIIKIDEEKENIEETITQNISNLCTTWGLSVEQVKNDMKGYTFMSETNDFLQFKDAESSALLAYKFDETGLISSVLISSYKQDKKNIDKTMSEFSYIGNKSNALVYYNQEKNTIGLNYPLTFNENTYNIYGFSPIETSSSYIRELEQILQVSVETKEATKIEQYTVTLNGKISSLNNVEEVGFIYGTDSDLSETKGLKIKASSSTDFSYDITNLSPATSYYYRTYFLIMGTFIMGEVKSFSTK